MERGRRRTVSTCIHINLFPNTVSALFLIGTESIIIIVKTVSVAVYIAVNLGLVSVALLVKLLTKGISTAAGALQKAGLIIGDRSFRYVDKYKYKYDLSEEWTKMTSLPFVFAAWVSNKKLQDTFVYKFNHALELGLKSRDIVAQQYISENPHSGIDVKSYLLKDISYALDVEKREAMDLFLKLPDNI